MSDNYEITHVFKEVFSTAFGYMHMTDVFNFTTHVNDSSRIFYNRLENLSTYNVFNIQFSLSIPITSWLTTTTSLNAFHDHYFGKIAEVDFSIRQNTMIFFTLNSFSLKKGWSIEAAFFYRSLNMNGTWRETPISSLDVGIKKKFANGKGSATLNFSDVFRQSYQNGTSVYGDVNFKVTGRDDRRRVGLSVSWKLGKSQYERDEKKKSGEEELNRAK
jgi:hypothetical protein